MRDAADDAVRDLARFQVEVFQDERLYARVRAVEPATPADRQLKQDLLDAFEDFGVALVPPARARAREIADRITVLAQEFSRNLRDNPTKLTFTVDECRGLPAGWLDRVARDDEGRIVVGFDYPDFNPFMANAESEAARERYFVAYLQRGTPRNIEVLDEIVALRRELASLHGLPSYADVVTRRRMAGSPGAVAAFLAGVRDTVADVERRDLEALRGMKAERTGRPVADTTLHRWDVAFYTERLRERRYHVDQEALRRYFPTTATLDWALLVAARLYGIRFERADVPVWHDDVVYYDIFDGDPEPGARLGGLYLDLFPRDGKFTHAAAWPVRGASRRVGRTPISVLVANFDRRGLTHDEVETLFHEFGHVFHGVLSGTYYNQHAGTSVQRDFVEAPSQIFEEWARRIECLDLMREVAPDCPVMDEALVGRLDEARRFARGILYARQWLYASFDMALAGPAPEPAIALWARMERDSALGHIEGTEFPGTFAHVASGYAAGYYGYMWAEVIALDMLSAFGSTLMNPAVGRRFRREILGRGGEAPAAALVEAFLGRQASPDAFFAEITGRRASLPSSGLANHGSR